MHNAYPDGNGYDPHNFRRLIALKPYLFTPQSYNSMGQNPCEITAALDQACLGYSGSSSAHPRQGCCSSMFTYSFRHTLSTRCWDKLFCPPGKPSSSEGVLLQYSHLQFERRLCPLPIQLFCPGAHVSVPKATLQGVPTNRTFIK